MLSLETDITQRIISLLESAPKPLTFTKLKEAARSQDEELKNALDIAVSQQSVFRWPDYRGSQYFWSRSPDHAAQQAVLSIASGEALSRGKLIAQACKRIPGFSQKAMERIVANLCADRELQLVPAFTTGKLLIRFGSRTAYAVSAQRFLAEKFRKAGFGSPQIPGPTSPAIIQSPLGSSDAAAQILDAIQRIDSRALQEGYPISAQRLRAVLPGLTKQQFDACALELRDQQKVFLDQHHDPDNLQPHERDLLIDGGSGIYYVSIAVR